MLTDKLKRGSDNALIALSLPRFKIQYVWMLRESQHDAITILDTAGPSALETSVFCVRVSLRLYNRSHGSLYKTIPYAHPAGRFVGKPWNGNYRS